MMRKTVGLFLCFVLLGAIISTSCAHARSEDALYSKGATWQETLHATRANYHQWLAKDSGLAGLQFGTWHYTAPLPADSFDDSAFPEEELSFNQRGKKGERLWFHHQSFGDGVVQKLICPAQSAIYLARIIHADTAQTLHAGVGSDDGMKLWLNGELLLSRDVARIAAPNQELIDLPLKTGDNLLLLRIYNVGGDAGFYFGAANDPTAALWQRFKQDYPAEAIRLESDLAEAGGKTWFSSEDPKTLELSLISHVLDQSAPGDAALQQEFAELSDGESDTLQRLDLYARACAVRDGMHRLEQIDRAALRRAIIYLSESYPDSYKKGDKYLQQLDTIERLFQEIREEGRESTLEMKEAVDALVRLHREALLANPLLDFDQVMLIRRSVNRAGLPQNWQGNCSLPRKGYDNEIVVLDAFKEAAKPSRLFRPDQDILIADIDLHFDGDKMLFSMLGSHDRWQIWEMATDGTGLRQVTPGLESDVDNYDACYLPDGRIIFDSTRCIQGIPCVTGSDAVANLYSMDADGGNVRQLCFDQDHDWCPTVLNNGRILYSRWEYSDTPHYFSRLLFHMNPDGTNQVEFYGSNSFWPNSMFYTRPIPNDPTKVVTIVSGHHGIARLGELVILDPAKGRHEASGVVQRIPGYGQPVEPVIADELVQNSWPQFIHPFPLSDSFFLVSARLKPDKALGLYLVDRFDNMLLLYEEPGYDMYEPLPLRAQPTPPAIPDRVNLARTDATVYLMDVYEGPGLANVPRDTVKKLRLYSFHYGYPHIGGHQHVGMEGPWDIHRILGTVPVAEDGSAYFQVPANTPIAVQPLDAENKAVQVMRSWFTAMPGEVLSCVGCHEPQNTTAAVQFNRAARRAPDTIMPWYGKERGFSFRHEVQPVLDRHCVGCHGAEPITDGRPDFSHRAEKGEGNFHQSYLALHPYVRRPGPESDYHLQKPMEWHADTSELVQLLQKGHYGVSLDEEAWDRLITWIDLNVPDHGRWSDHIDIPGNSCVRRAEMRALYSHLPEDDTEEELTVADYPDQYEAPQGDTPTPAPYQKGWAFSAEEAAQRQQQGGAEIKRSLTLADGITMDFVWIPAGSFCMGGEHFADESPSTTVTIDTPFWLGVTEVTNAQYACYDAEHDSRYIDQHNKDHTTPGYPANEADQPVIRVSWHEALAFTDWLSTQSGTPCTLPTEAQWEWACRAGGADALFYGGLDTDFSPYANLADASVIRLAVAGVNPQPIPNPSPFMDFLPKDPRFDDGERLVCAVGQYAPNPWGLKDMHGNVCEWTRSAYLPYPYKDDDGRNDIIGEAKRVVRGGSWTDRPFRARSAFRTPYQPWQAVQNVGFRVMIRIDDETQKIAMETP
ncbi:MAG: SUMF1/EgtB/PvdO family nonheme iron enzyme [Candidatus Hydrogenedentales bacterium]